MKEDDKSYAQFKQTQRDGTVMNSKPVLPSITKKFGLENGASSNSPTSRAAKLSLGSTSQFSKQLNPQLMNGSGSTTNTNSTSRLINDMNLSKFHNLNVIYNTNTYNYNMPLTQKAANVKKPKPKYQL